MVRGVVDGEKKEQAKLLAAQEQRNKTCDILRAQIISIKESNEKKKQDEADLDKRLRDRADAIFLDNTSARKIKKVESAKIHEIKMREIKKAKALTEKAQESALDERNEKFNDIQRFINEKRKEIQKDNLESRQNEMERIGRRGYKERQEELTGLRKFELSFQCSKDMEYETMNGIEVERRRQYLKNANTTDEKRSQTFSKYKADDDLFLSTWSKSRGNKPRTPEYRPSEEEKKATRGVKARELQKHVRIQIAANATAKAKFDEADVKVDTKNRDYYKNDVIEFQRYGEFLVKLMF
jgi:hypothetical protein